MTTPSTTTDWRLSTIDYRKGKFIFNGVATSSQNAAIFMQYFLLTVKDVLLIHHRLAAKGVEPTQRRSNADSIAIGKTLLQQLMEANKNDLEAKLEAYNRHKQECQLINRGFAFAKGNSKALAAQYVRKQDAADNARRRANVHHTGRYVKLSKF